MSARPPLSFEEIREALSACDGRVSRAARLLGIARNNLYKRLASAGINPDEYRAARSAARPAPTAPAVRPARPLRKSRTVYLRPDQVRLIDDACLDLPAALREKVSPSRVLELLMDDCFAGWLASKLGR